MGLPFSHNYHQFIDQSFKCGLALDSDQSISRYITQDKYIYLFYIMRPQRGEKMEVEKYYKCEKNEVASICTFHFFISKLFKSLK